MVSNNTIKSILVSFLGTAAIALALAGGVSAYADYAKNKSFEDCKKLKPAEVKIFNDLKKRNVSENEIKEDLFQLKRFNVSFNSAKNAIQNNNAKAALDYIINANGYISKVKYIDTREVRADLLELRKNLQKLIETEKRISERDKEIEDSKKRKDAILSDVEKKKKEMEKEVKDYLNE